MHNYNTASTYNGNFKSLCILGTEQWSGKIYIRTPPTRPPVLIMTIPLAAKG